MGECNQLPPFEIAFRHAREECGKRKCDRKWMHDAIYVTCQSVSFYDMKTVADDGAGIVGLRKRFAVEYEKNVIRVRDGFDAGGPCAQMSPEAVYVKTEKIEAIAEKTIGSIMSMFDE